MRDTKPLRKRDWALIQLHGKSDYWIKSDWYCYMCGKQDVWQLNSAGDDYYVNHSAICHSCNEDMIGLDKVEEEK